MPAASKAVQHLVLLPNDRQTARQLWPKAAEFALAHPQTLVGTSTEAAFQASEVTLVGGSEAFSPEFEAKLRDAGCRVQRMSLVDPKAVASCGCAAHTQGSDTSSSSQASGVNHG